MDFQRIANYFPGLFGGSYTFNSYADFASGNPFSYSQAFAGDGTNGPLSEPNVNEYAFYAGVGRNTITGPNFAQVDIRLSRDLALYGELSRCG